MSKAADTRQEIAASRDGLDITRGWLDALQQVPIEDSIVRSRGGDLKIYEEVLRDDTARAAINQRTHGVLAAPWQVEPGGNRAIDKAAAAHLKAQIERLQWDTITAHMLSGVFYGYSVAEVLWSTEGGKVGIADIKVRNRRRFAFDGAGGLRLKTHTNPWPGDAMPERKFWLARFGADHADAPYGLGLAHYLYWPVFMKRHALRFWSVFLEKFGTPTVLGRYPGGTEATEQTKLLEALQAVQRDSTVILPEGMDATLLEATRAGSADHAGFVSAMDKAILKITLGQTATVEGTAGSLGGEGERERVKDAIIRADADILSASFFASVATWLTEWNFPGAAVPRLWRTFDSEDLDRRIVRDKTLFDMGYRPAPAYVKDTYGGDYVDTGAAPAPASGPAAPAAPTAPTYSEAPAKAPASSPAGDAIDAAIAAELGQWQPLLSPMAGPVQAYLDHAQQQGLSAQQTIEGLPALLAKMDSAPLAASLTRLQFAAAAAQAGAAPEDASL